jgi:putative phosphoesterase
VKRICLLSDTHSHFDERMLTLAAEADEIWHAGDFGDPVVSEKLSSLKPFRGVYGNIDGQAIRMVYPEHLFFTVEGISILMIHIAGPFGKYSPEARKLILEFRPKVLVCGHSHILKVQQDERHQLLYMNPGAAGKHGFHKVRTLLRFSIDGDRLKDLEAVELGLRGAVEA